MLQTATFAINSIRLTGQAVHIILYSFSYLFKVILIQIDNESNIAAHIVACDIFNRTRVNDVNVYRYVCRIGRQRENIYVIRLSCAFESNS